MGGQFESSNIAYIAYIANIAQDYLLYSSNYYLLLRVSNKYTEKTHKSFY